MKILITGGTGGVAEYFREYFSNYQVHSMDKNCLDVSDRIHTMDTIRSIHPDIVLHLAAISDINRCEKDESLAYRVNTVGTLNVAFACANFDIPIVYISTNQVFDGYSKKPYLENDNCNPLNNFGKTKLAGESLIKTLCRKYYIIRTCWIFGHSKCIVKETLGRYEMSMNEAYFETANLTYIQDLCTVIEKLIFSNQFGTYNCTNTGIVSSRVWINKAFSLLGYDHETISFKIPGLNYNKPLIPNFAPLDCSLIYDTFNIKLPTWEERLTNYLSKI